MYTPRPEDLAELQKRFNFHPALPEKGQPKRYEQVRGACRVLAEQLLTLCPASRELSVALTNLEQVMFWSCASIARNEHSTQ